MESTVEVKEVAALPIAGVAGMVTAGNLPVGIRALFDKFYSGFKSKGEFNIVLYPTFIPAGEFEIVCGVLVAEGGNASTPAGTVATSVHMGPYSELKVAHGAIHKWVREKGRQLAGASWEVYGHWNDDPAKLRTDVFYLLK